MSNHLNAVAYKVIKENSDLSPEAQRDLVVAAFGLDHPPRSPRLLEVCNEPIRRAKMARLHAERKERRRPASAKGTFDRRVIFVDRGEQRTVYYHATKGWRSYRTPA